MRKTTIRMTLLAGLWIAMPVIGEDNYCWKDSYGRGVGTIPSDCGFSEEKQGLLCYPKCGAGFSGAGPVCWQNCPAGFSDDGAFCGKPAAYGRGWGHPWQIQDGFSNSGMLSRCQASEGRACEMWGAMAYPTCKDGFASFGSNVCSPVCPAGMPDIGVSCTKQTSTRATIAAQCGGGQVYETGLCYSSCKGGYNGVGPVCWGTCPANKPFACGAGCATNEAECIKATSDQVLSVVSSVASIALSAVTGGAGGAALQAGMAGAKVGANAAAKTLATGITKATIKATIKTEAQKQGKQIAESTLESWGTTLATYDGSMAASAAAGDDPPEFEWASLDPTGIGSIVTAYNHPVCAPPPANSPLSGLNGAPAPTSTIPLPVKATPPAKNWQQRPGLARDIAATAGGTVWAISVNAVAGGFEIYRLKPGAADWTKMPGAGTRIAAAGEHVWAINDGGDIFRWQSAANAWERMFGGGAKDIAVDAAGNAFIIGVQGRIWELKAGKSAWTYLPSLKDSNLADTGEPVRIAANGTEQLLVLESRNSWAFKLIGGQGWTRSSGTDITDIAVSADGNEYKSFKVAGLGIRVWFGPTVTTLPQDQSDLTPFASIAAGGNGRVWGVKTDGRIFKFIGVI